MKNIGLVLPEAESIGKKRPLTQSVNSYLSALESPLIDAVLIPAKDRAGRLHYRSSKLGQLVAEPLLTSQFMQNVRSRVQRMLIEVRMLDDISLVEDDQRIHEYSQGRIAVIPDRVCPTSESYLSRILLISNELAAEFQPDGLHFPYFRYQNVNQCFCSRCLSKFSAFSGFRTASAERLSAELASDAALFSAWVSWRASTLVDVMKMLRSGLQANVELSLEIDVDYRRNYLTGVHLDEGLDLYRLAEQADEVFLHVQPAGWPPQARALQETMDLLRFAIGELERRSVRPTLFFWFLQTEADFKRAFTVLRGSAATSSFFFDTAPRRFEGWLRQAMRLRPSR